MPFLICGGLLIYLLVHLTLIVKYLFYDNHTLLILQNIAQKYLKVKCSTSQCRIEFAKNLNVITMNLTFSQGVMPLQHYIYGELLNVKCIYAWKEQKIIPQETWAVANMEMWADEWILNSILQIITAWLFLWTRHPNPQT